MYATAQAQPQLPSGYNIISLSDMHAAGKAADKEFARHKEQSKDAAYSWTFFYTRQIEALVAKRVSEILVRQ